jgi:hypothetical protein
MELNIKELESIIKDGDFSKLIGESESIFFDCKREVYVLKNDISKYELAKDVSAFANARGGYILIGIDTKKSLKSFYDEIVAINAFKESVCNPIQYTDIVLNWIYPKLRDVEARWYPTKENPSKGIFIIEIPNQPEINKPFLIKRTIQDTGKICEVLFGYSERKQESNDPKTVVELHQILRDGLNLDKRLQSIETAIQDLSKPAPQINDEFYDVEKRIYVALSAAEMNEKRAMILTCYPDIPTKLRTLFSSKHGSLKSILESPPKIREMGFGTRVFDKATIMRGMFCRVTGGRRKVIDLYKDGVLIAGFEADVDFLCWGMRDLIINPVALIESIYNFVQLYECVIHDMAEKPNKIYFRIDMKNLHLDNEKNKLAVGNLEDIKCLFGDEIRYAPKDSWFDSLEVELEDFELSRVAYNITEIIYVYFGLEIEDIPYTKEIDGMKSIDVEQIKSI